MEREHRASPELRIHGHEPLRIMHLGPIDPGAAVFRLHNAINSTTPHSSVEATGKVEFIAEPQQFDIRFDWELLKRLGADFDFAHCHVNYHGIDELELEPKLGIVIHHHGTVFRNDPDEWTVRDHARGALRLVSNFELLRYADDLHYLPLAVPAERYRRLAANRPSWDERPFVIAHSPTKFENKGTDEFLEAVETLRSHGLEIRLELIHRAPLSQSLRAKTRAHAVFDSFWLGLQMSGLEGGAMGLPVIAGDEFVASQYRERLGEVPYTFADSRGDLLEVIDRLARDRDFYESESSRVERYVRRVHDPATVVQRYLELLDERFSWREALSL